MPLPQQQSLAGRKQLMGKQLGERFERGERWGRDRIAEARAEIQAEKAAGAIVGETDQQDTRVPVGTGVA